MRPNQALGLTVNTAVRLRFGSVLVSTPDDSATVGGLCQQPLAGVTDLRGGSFSMRTALRVLIVLATVPPVVACSAFGPRLQTITVISDPPDAEVFLNGNHKGNTPLRTQVRRGEELLVELRKPGFQTAYRTSQRTLSTLGIIDAAGGAVILLPFFGLLSPAAWEHEPAIFAVTLDPSEPKPEH